MIRPYGAVSPSLGARVYVDESAQVIGDVTLGDDASVWMNTVLRGDVNAIRIGARTNVQDSCVFHGTREDSTELGEGVTVGHAAVLHGCRVGASCLIGMGAIIMSGVQVGEESIVAAGSLVPERMRIAPRSIVKGSPARVIRKLSEEEVEGLRHYAATYVEFKDAYRAQAEKRS